MKLRYKSLLPIAAIALSTAVISCEKEIIEPNVENNNRGRIEPPPGEDDYTPPNPADTTKMGG